ncbi:unnamed protein product [Amoebophrya sp. A25]|nr:unnamed protein product [Amoebophrya sp. A25]|eukprot:GSA25T00026150001.1
MSSSSDPVLERQAQAQDFGGNIRDRLAGVEALPLSDRLSRLLDVYSSATTESSLPPLPWTASQNNAISGTTNSAAMTSGTYLRAVGVTLKASLNSMMDIPSPVVERQNHRPEVEVEEMVPECRCRPVYIARDEQEACMIEATVNSVRVSFRFRLADETERTLVSMYARFLTQQSRRSLSSSHNILADILRKEPMPSYDITFLFTAAAQLPQKVLCGAPEDLRLLKNPVADLPRGASNYGEMKHRSLGGIHAPHGTDPVDGSTAPVELTNFSTASSAKSNEPDSLVSWDAIIARGETVTMQTQSIDKQVNFVLRIVEDFDRDIKDWKLALNRRLRSAAKAYTAWDHLPN